jgi:hypothetical protein
MSLDPSDVWRGIAGKQLPAIAPGHFDVEAPGSFDLDPCDLNVGAVVPHSNGTAAFSLLHGDPDQLDLVSTRATQPGCRSQFLTLGIFRV